MVSDEVKVALITASLPTLGIIVSAYFQFKSTRKAQKSLNEIHDLTNQSASDAVDKINDLNKTINKLERKITHKDQQLHG